jgi:hypothetical protein
MTATMAVKERLDRFEYLIAKALVRNTGGSSGSPVAGLFDVQAPPYNAKGDFVTDDTAAIQSAIADAQAAGGGIVLFPPPKVSYRISSILNITQPGMVLLGLGVASSNYPMITQGVYGATIFNSVATNNVTISGLSGQYGPTTTLAAPATIGATSITVVSAAGININDWLILDQYPNLEQVQVLSVVGTTVNLQVATPVAIAHAPGAWVRDQATIAGNTYGNPSRDIAGLANFVNCNGCTVENCAVQAMVTAVKFRGDPLVNANNNSGNSVLHLATDFTQFGVLFQQQTDLKVLYTRYTNATGGQPAAPGHSIYASGNNGPPGAWNAGTTYAQYATATFGGNIYISIVGGNLANEPDVSPGQWQLQAGGANGWKQTNTSLTIADVYASPGFNFKNWAGFTIKFTHGGTASGITMESCDRAFNMQECTDFSFSAFSFSNFIPPDNSDGSAAALDVLNCNRCTFGPGTVDLRQSDGTSIDMPIVLNRVSTAGGGDPANDGQQNDFVSILAYTNYSGAFTSAAYQNTGCKNTRFVTCKLVETGGNNPYAFHFEEDVTDAQFPDGCQLVRPTVVGTTRIAFVSPGTGTGPSGAVIWDIDNNLVSSGAIYSDPGSGAVITNRYITNAGGVSTFTPQSTSTTVIRIVSPVGAAYNYINATASGGSTEFSVGNQTGTKMLVESSDVTNGGFIGVGFNSTAGFATLNETFAGLAFVVNGGTVNGSDAGIFAIAAEAQGVGATGTDIVVQGIQPGTTTKYVGLHVYGTGDVSLNGQGSALTTGATAGFTFLPSMAGTPTGTPATHTGTTPFVYDTTNQTLWVRAGSAWVEQKAQRVAALSPTTGSTFTPGSFNRLGSSQNGNSYVLTDPTLCKGSSITIKVTSVPLSVTLTSGGAGNVENQTSYVFNASGLTEITFESDGTNWWLATQTDYVIDSPAAHGLIEWMGQPAAFGSNRQPTSQTLNLIKFVPRTGGLISNIVAVVGTLGSGFTAATTAAISNVVNNGSGACRVTATAHGFSTNDVITNAGIVGATEANGAFVITVIDANTFDLNGSTFTAAYVSGGTATRSANVCAIYDNTGAFLTATGDQVTPWGSTGAKTMALATTITVIPGKTYYCALLSVATTTPIFLGGAGANIANVGLSTSTLLWSSNGTAATKLPNSFTPGSNATTNAVTVWAAWS